MSPRAEIPGHQESADLEEESDEEEEYEDEQDDDPASQDYNTASKLK